MSTRIGKILLAALVAAPLTAFAGDFAGPSVGVVPFGMGRAYSAVADDWLALHYNPAGLALVRRIDVQVFDLKLESNNDVLHSYSSLKGLGKNSNGSLASSLDGLAGKHIMADLSDVTQLTIPNFAMAFVYDNHIDFDYENLSNPDIAMRYTKDLTLMAGGAIAGGPKKALRLGATIKWTSRTGGERDVPITQIMGSKKSMEDLFSQSGSGIGGDLGMQYRLPIDGRTEYTTSWVWHDVGKTSFGGAQVQDAPTRIDDDMVAGFGIRIPIGGRQNRRLERRYGPTRSWNALSFAFDYDHVNTSWNQQPIAKHMHFGANLDLPLFSFQLGFNQSALTFGSQFDIGILRIALATYGEELGSYAGQKVDRRYMISIGSDFGFTALK